MGISKIRNLSCKKFRHVRNANLRCLSKYFTSPYMYINLIIIPFTRVQAVGFARKGIDLKFIEKFYHRNFTWTRRDVTSRIAFMRVCTFYTNKDIAAFVYFPVIHIDRKRTLLSTQSTVLLEQPRFKAVVARKLARSFARPSHIVTSNTKNDERRSFRLEYRDCYPTTSTTTYF